MKKILPILCIATVSSPALACTGITLHARDGATISARTIDWAEAATDNIYMVIPRGHTEQSLLPDGSQNGIQFTSRYGFVGLGAQRPEFVIDGTNETGLNAALFYFPDYGEYQKYDESMRDITLSDIQVVSWILANFSSIDELKNNINNVRIVSTEPGASTVHWRITEASGRAVVMEIINGTPTFHEDEIGVITNAPNFTWQHTNLNNYVNLKSGTAAPMQLGPDTLQSFSGGTGLLGLPGDFSSPSRFVRASFFSNMTIEQPDGPDTVNQAFHILNNFDVPFGTAFAKGREPVKMPSATQWTIASDLKNKVVYYHTMYNRTIRKIDMGAINFTTVPFQYGPLDDAKAEMIIPVQITQ
jgi:choloylglycine hydrolase